MSGVDLSGAVWQKSGPSGEGRVEIAFLADGHVGVRDGGAQDGPVLVFTPQEWEAFVGGVRDGEFDLA